MHRMSKQDTARRRRVRYDAVLAFFVFLGDPASPFRFFFVPSTGAASALLGFDGLLVGCVAGVVSTSISPESSIGARDPSGAKRCLSSSGGCLGRGGFWCTTGEDSGDNAGGVGREGRAEITRRRETACGAALWCIRSRETSNAERRGRAGEKRRTLVQLSILLAAGEEARDGAELVSADGLCVVVP